MDTDTHTRVCAFSWSGIPSVATAVAPAASVDEPPPTSVTTPPTSLTVDVWTAPVSPNRLMAEHWQSRHHRRQRERKAVAKALSGKRRPLGPWCVTLTRIGAAFWDDDNWATSAKAYRDEVTRWIGLKNDRDPRIVWAYDQAKARIAITQLVKGRVRKTFRTWCRISIETRNVESLEACHV